MKKTINIHLCNRIFTIDEDACQLLESYITNMRTYFSKREYGAEIADDIELRVSELLEEFKTSGATSITGTHCTNWESRGNGGGMKSLH